MTVLPRRVLVVGLARSGQAAALALAARGIAVVGVDRSQDLDAGRLAAAGVEVRLGTEEESLLEGIELVVKSPGVPGESPLVVGARRRSLPVWSEVELGYRLVENPIVGVTGTNGKTTTVALLGAIFRASGREAVLAGNEQALQLSDLGGSLARDAWIVCELSSFQLEDIASFRPEVGVLTNFEPDHLNRHGSVGAYRAAKLRLFENQHPGDTAVVPRGFEDVPGGARRVEFERGDLLPAEPRIPGAHNRENAAAATAAARAVGVPDAAIADALASFAGVAHRLELVAELDGVRFVNDSKATNTTAARRAVEAYEAPLRIILGGSRKGERFDDLAQALRGRARSAYLIGEAASDLAPALAGAGVPYEGSGDLPAAVRAAAAAAQPGEVVLLSPACASYDQFQNFEERGEAFRRLVAGLRP